MEVTELPGNYPPLDKVIQLGMRAVGVPDIAFVPYQPELRKNVLIHVLFDNKPGDPLGSDAALIKYLPGALTPRHLHIGSRWCWCWTASMSRTTSRRRRVR